MLIIVLPALLIAQAEVIEDGKVKKENKNRSLLGYAIAQGATPARTPYESGYLIDNMTNIIPAAKTLEFIIQHRFGSMENGISDIWGIYGTANTRLGLNYSITDWLQVGFGTTKQYKIQDFGLKVNILQQSRDNQVPVAVTYYGNWSIDARSKDNFGADSTFRGLDRFAFYNELMVTRKFTDWFTFTLGGSFSHFNKVDSLYDHDRFALHFMGRFKISSQSSIIINYDLPLDIQGISEWADHHNPADPPKSNFGFGWEISTSTHAFQIFAGTSTLLVPQYNVMLNQNDWTKGDFFIGFNITRLWGF